VTLSPLPSLWRRLRSGPTHDADLDLYARLEAETAYELAARHGHTLEEAREHASSITSLHAHDITELAEALIRKGRVEWRAATRDLTGNGER
jgi:hypothetical protein